MKKIANILIFASTVLLLVIFWPVAKEETKYQINQTFQKRVEVTPPNRDFSIVIPKIGASQKIIRNVDPYNKAEFLKALKNGVAHAKNTSFPDKNGNIYLFAHSTDAFYNVLNYNAVFYLIGKLEKDDEIKLYYQDNEYRYKVIEKKIVSASDTYYLTRKTQDNILTLQTCYPPGTTLKRLIVVAKVDK